MGNEMHGSTPGEICVICSMAIGPDHEDSVEHRIRLAYTVVDITDFVGLCYWCKTLTPIAECRDGRHAEMLSEYREVVTNDNKRFWYRSDM